MIIKPFSMVVEYVYHMKWLYRDLILITETKF